jgi:hypothetical protein
LSFFWLFLDVFPFEEVQVVMLPSNKLLEWPGTVLASLPLLKELLLAQNPIAEVLLIISSTMFVRVAFPTNWHAPLFHKIVPGLHIFLKSFWQNI